MKEMSQIRSFKRTRLIQTRPPPALSSCVDRQRMDGHRAASCQKQKLLERGRRDFGAPSFNPHPRSPSLSITTTSSSQSSHEGVGCLDTAGGQRSDWVKHRWSSCWILPPLNIQPPTTLCLHVTLWEWHYISTSFFLIIQFVPHKLKCSVWPLLLSHVSWSGSDCLRVWITLGYYSCGMFSCKNGVNPQRLEPT